MADGSSNIMDENFSSLLLESMADGVFAMDSEGKITLWNRSMERITGHKANEIIGESCDVLKFNL